MKRSNPEEFPESGRPDGSSKRYRAEGYTEALAEGKFEMRLLIPTKAAGAVIGKGGEGIKGIRAKFDAQLSVPDRSTPERVLLILARQEVIIDCFSEVLHKLAEDQKRNDVEIRMLVHQSHAGAIIGRGGSKIKELREQSQAQIKVFQDCCPNSTDRVVAISCNQEQMPHAVRVLVDFMREIPIKGAMRPYDATNYDPRLAFTYGGYTTEIKHGGHGGFDRRGEAMGHMNMRGPPMPPAPYADYGRGGPPMGGGYGGGGGGGGYNAGRPPIPPMGGGYGMHEAVSTTQVTIPNELGGTIIGKGGERINRIRMESGARIDVGTAYGNEERIITISGTPHQIQTAQYLLQQSVRTSEAGRRYLREQH